MPGKAFSTHLHRSVIKFGLNVAMNEISEVQIDNLQLFVMKASFVWFEKADFQFTQAMKK